ncbi:peptidoglycan-binding protein [Streptomyces sp. NPDC049687]|uniref:peptidoglycan-binding protein n=1 Tax=Streptomyces sp. NPDC049687 TaxID=3365596 RepID=UPI0037B14C11
MEPIRVLRPRNTDALAELFREMTELTKDPVAYESIPLPAEPAADIEPETEEFPPVGPPGGSDRAGHRPQDGPPPEPAADRDWTGDHAPHEPPPGRPETGDGYAFSPGPTGAGPGQAAGSYRGAAVPGGVQERRRAAYATVTGRTGAARGGADAGSAGRRRRAAHGAASVVSGGRARDRSGSGAGLRRAAITVGVCAAALVGFACALLVPGRGGEAAAETVQPAPTASETAPSSPSADPDGAGTLREGDTGPEVTDLQQRLLKIPDVYQNGATDGRYDTVLAEAVARFQLWYGIRGDEDGVYGDDTREALESRTNG